MKRLIPSLLAACLALSISNAEEVRPDPNAKPATEEEIKARLAEHARRKAMGSAVADTGASDDKKPSETGAPVKTQAVSKETESKEAAAAKTTAVKEEEPTVLPKLQVRKERITELDRKLDKQNKEIAREKQNTKPTKLDETLNSPRVSKALSIFGGQSSDDRASIAKERVAMMEDERDLIEAIEQAETKEEKEELQKTLDTMRAMRRDLEQSLR